MALRFPVLVDCKACQFPIHIYTDLAQQVAHDLSYTAPLSWSIGERVEPTVTFNRSKCGLTVHLALCRPGSGKQVHTIGSWGCALPNFVVQRRGSPWTENKEHLPLDAGRKRQ